MLTWVTVLESWPNVPPNSSQLEPSSQLWWIWVSFQATHLAWVGSSWIELAWILSSSNSRSSRAKFSSLFGHLSQLKPTLNKLFCYCYATVRGRIQTFWMVPCKLARLGGTVWPSANASFDCDFVTWLELGVPFGHGLYITIDARIWKLCMKLTVFKLPTRYDMNLSHHELTICGALIVAWKPLKRRKVQNGKVVSSAGGVLSPVDYLL